MWASVVVPTFNRRKALERTLDGLFGQSYDPGDFEIVVVDDCSQDDTPMAMAKLIGSRRNTVFIRHDKNLGRAVTRNDGIVAARGDIVIFLDDDNVPCPTFVEAHVECHRRAAPAQIAVMGNASFATSSLRGSNFAHYMNTQYLGNRSPSGRRGLDYENLPAKCFGTLNASVGRVVAMNIGMFDTAFRHYGGEDFFFGHCLRRAGIRLCFCERARTIHHDEVSVERYKVKYREAAREGIPIIQGRDATALDETNLKNMMPIAWRTDSVLTVVKKYAIRGALNDLVLAALEYWARVTDGYPALSSRACYRLLLAGWYLQGLKSRDPGRGEVTYGGA